MPPDPESATIAMLRDACIEVRPWIDECDDIKDACTILDQVLLVEAILAHKEQADEAMTAARFLEARVGELLGPTYQELPPGGSIWRPTGATSSGILAQ